MSDARKIVLYCPDGFPPLLEQMVGDWIRRKVALVGVVGPKCELIHDVIDEFILDHELANGTKVGLLTTRHTNEGVEEVVEFFTHGFIGDEYGPTIEILKLKAS